MRELLLKHFIGFAVVSAWVAIMLFLVTLDLRRSDHPCYVAMEEYQSILKGKGQATAEDWLEVSSICEGSLPEN